MPEKQKPFRKGDHVMFTVSFCRSVGLYASNDPLVHRQFGAVVLGVAPFGSGWLVTCQDTNGDSRKVNSANLTLASTKRVTL